MKLQTVTKPKKVAEIIEANHTAVDGRIQDFTNAEVVCKDIQENLKGNHQYYDTICSLCLDVHLLFQTGLYATAVYSYLSCTLLYLQQDEQKIQSRAGSDRSKIRIKNNRFNSGSDGRKTFRRGKTYTE